MCKAVTVLCPLCRQRKARRTCPALNQQICAVCCGTKRLVEIWCPADCPYLASARTHPPAVVQRQQQRDVQALVPALAGLTERQTQLFFLILGAIARHTVSESLQRTIDKDVAAAAASLAATHETASRGVIYEHQVEGLPAQRLMQELKGSIRELTDRGGRSLERDLSVVLRRVEKSAGEARLSVDGGDTAFLELISRVLTRVQASSDAPPSEGPGRVAER